MNVVNGSRFSRLDPEGLRRQRTTSIILGVLWVGLGVLRTISVVQAGFAVWLTVGSFGLAAAFLVRGLLAEHELKRRERETVSGGEAE